MTGDDIIGINWASNAFRAYRIGPGGEVRGERSADAGVARLDRAGMIATLDEMLGPWRDVTDIYASGMIGSNIGWSETSYVTCPAEVGTFARKLSEVSIGAWPVLINPGLACERIVDDAPDIMRGEEIEVLGAISTYECRDALVVLPGAHSKWVMVRDGVLAGFFTSMCGEMFNRLTSGGLLASLVEPGALVENDESFRAGMDAGMRDGPGLGTLMFGTRALVMRRGLSPANAGAYLRGLLVGAEITDACRLLVGWKQMPVLLSVGSDIADLYAAAFGRLAIKPTTFDRHEAVAAGFTALHRARFQLGA